MLLLEEMQRKQQGVSTMSRPSWQRESDLAVRENMLCSIMELVTNKLERYVDISKWDYIVRYAQHIEVKVYANAGSLAEYSNEKTLLARYFHVSSSLLRNMQSEKEQLLNIPHIVLDQGNVSTPTIERPLKKIKFAESSFFLKGQEDIIRRVYSFVSTADIIKQTRISKFSSHILPQCVTRMSFDATNFIKKPFIYSMDLPENILKKYVNLEELEIYHAATAPKKPLCPDMITKANAVFQISMQVSNSSERVVQQFGRALAKQSALKLERLCISSVFFNTETINAIGEIASALISGCCPNLQELYIGANSISDMGATRIADFIISGTCPKLRVLDLRRNAIGERGIHSIVDAVISGKIPFLEKLLLGGNLLSDCSAIYVANMLATGACWNLRALTLDYNFLGSEGVGDIARALLKSKCRELRYLDFAGNSTNDGAVAIAKLLEQNSCPRLTSVDVGNISEVAAQAIEEALRHRRKARSR